jgi:hypothetical protein
MQLSKESTTASLYRWYYATKNMPQSLCPYFWKVVIMYLTIIPYTILSLPYMVLNGKDKSSAWGEKPGSGFLIWVGLGLVASMFWSLTIFFVGLFPKDSFAQGMQILGLMLWVVAIGTSIGLLVRWLVEKHKQSKIKYDEYGYRIWEPVKQKDPNLIVEFIKASYNKYCPKIDWTSKNS